MPKRLHIYVAGPYTAAELEALEKNAKAAIDAGIAILRKGHIPFIPHLTHYVDLRAHELKIEISWAEYMTWDQAWLDKCDALLYLGSSRGADIELSRAVSKGMQVFHSLNEIPSNIEEFSPKAF
jgi:hypothetical protein